MMTYKKGNSILKPARQLYTTAAVGKGRRERNKSEKQKIHPDKHPLSLHLTVHGHLVNLGAVVLLNVAQNLHIFVRNKVDGHTLAAKAARSTNARKGIWQQHVRHASIKFP